MIIKKYHKIVTLKFDRNIIRGKFIHIGGDCMDMLLNNNNNNISQRLAMLSQKTKSRREKMNSAVCTKKDEIINRELNELEKDIYSTIK